MAAFKISPPTALISPPNPLHTFSTSRTNLSMPPNTQLTRNLSVHSCLQSKTTPSSRLSSRRQLPARDRVIDFGKYKGKMLGTVPSSYLKWISNNLRKTRGFETWARLADEVLDDPIYRDRIEWEFAENILTGNNSAAVYRGKGAASELLEISETFGWDFYNEAAWSKIDFGLLGTSKGGRIPRAAEREARGVEEDGGKVKQRRGASGEAGGGSVEDEGRRRERRERMKQRREVMGSGKGTSSDVGGTSGRSGKGEEGGESGMGRVPSRFPGRDELLRKAMNRERLI